MAKKNPYVFTIGFDETDPVHVRAAEILNGTKKKAQLMVLIQKESLIFMWNHFSLYWKS